MAGRAGGRWRRRSPGPWDFPAGGGRRFLASNLLDQARYAEAEKFQREALANMRKRLPGDHPGLANALNSLAEILREQGKHAEAEKVHREALAIFRQALPADHPLLPTSLNTLAETLSAQ